VNRKAKGSIDARRSRGRLCSTWISSRTPDRSNTRPASLSTTTGSTATAQPIQPRHLVHIDRRPGRGRRASQRNGALALDDGRHWLDTGDPLLFPEVGSRMDGGPVRTHHGHHESRLSTALANDGRSPSCIRHQRGGAYEGAAPTPVVVIVGTPIQEDTVKLEHTVNLRDVRELARRRLPRMIFDLIDGGADDEVTMRANEAAFSKIQFRPRTLVDVSTRTLATSVAGMQLTAPIVLSPAAGTRVVHPEAERAIARASGARHVPYVVTARASFTIEELADASEGPLWLGIEVIPDLDLMKRLLKRAHDAEYSALVFMVDAPVAGALERSLKRGAIPAKYTMRNVLDAARRPKWSVGFLRTAHLIAARNLGDTDVRRRFPPRPVVPGQALSSGPKRTWDDLARVRDLWDRPLIVKGILAPDDAARCADRGADGIVVSNHGGRQLDGAPATISVLHEIVQAVQGRAAVLLDGGIRRGSDVAKALALGAAACLIGRPYHYGLAAAGEEGVGRVIDILIAELDRTLAFLGCNSVGELDPSYLLSSPPAPGEVPNHEPRDVSPS
jgi:isopentenyl diphosphate isomerase/L-lactate dehydrogenase-like FMN-dependent dehydrogenase